VQTGVASTWSSDAWRAAAVAWLDERLEAAGARRTGAVEQPHLRPWATLLRAPTTRGVVWMKAAAPATSFEVPLYGLLARVVPDRVLEPIAADEERGWILLEDGGAPIAEDDDPSGFAAAVVDYGRLQRELMPHVDELLALGVHDMRPRAMPQRFEEALALAPDPSVAALRPQVREWCEQLAASPLPPSLDHNDLHRGNILAGGRFFDWGDSVVAHPFAVLLVPLDVDATVRDPYLEVFTDLAPRRELEGTLELACRVAAIARALTWERALRAARDQGEPVPAAWEQAPLKTLLRLAVANPPNVRVQRP
jgi:hypothetical protein